MSARRDPTTPPGHREDTLRLAVERDTDRFRCSRRCIDFAQSAGLDSRTAWELATAVTELVTNVLKFADQGTLCMRRLVHPRVGVEAVIEDQGSGMEDVELAIQDGYSEGRFLNPDERSGASTGLGAGLGAVHRLTDEVIIDSLPEGGTRVIVRKWKY